MQPKLWTLNALSIELGRDRRTLARLLEDLEPDVSSHKGARADLRWRLRRVVDHLFRPANAGELNAEQERARRDKEAADKLAMENAVRRGELAVVADLARIHGDEVARARARLLQLPAAIAQSLDPAIAGQVATAVLSRVREALEELSQ